MNKTVTIKENYVFRRMYSKGRSAVTPMVVVYCRKNGLDHNRLGVTVSTKLGGAVIRNRPAAACGRSIAWHSPGMHQGYDLVLVAPDPGDQRPLAQAHRRL